MYAFLESVMTMCGEWMKHNPTYAGFIILFLSLAESLAVVGLFIPGFMVMGVIGALVYDGYLNVWSTLGYAVVGAVLGDNVSYLIGRRFKRNLPNMWPFSRFPAWLTRGRAFFVKHGKLSIFVGRFVGPVRPFIPVVAGIMDMRSRPFMIANVASACVWAPVYIVPGMIVKWLIPYFPNLLAPFA